MVIWTYTVSDGFIVFGQIEIGLPQVIPQVWGAGHIITYTLYMAYVENMAAGDEAEKAVIYFDCPEALATVYDFIKIKFVPDKNMHGFFFPFNEWELFYKHYILLPAFFKDMIK